MLATVWASASTALSACIYLLDFGTTISALITYYHYEYQCPHAPLPSPLLHDPICRAILFTHSRRHYGFLTCLFFLTQAYLTYAFMFWITLDPRKHPLRLAYFMPLIHLYRLLKLLRHSFSSQGLKELQKIQEESSSLYSALGASLETIPQVIVQSSAALYLGQYLKSPSDPHMQAQRIPTNLILSLIASVVSGVYNASMAIWFLMKKHHVSLPRRAFVATMAGCQTFAAMLAKVFLVGALSNSVAVVIYLLVGVIVAWAFIGLLLQRHSKSQGKSKFLITLHSLGFALMTTYTGPIFVMVKLGERVRNLIWGTLLHIFVELIGLTLVFTLPSTLRGQESPCHSSQNTSTQELGNKFLTCKVFLGTILPSLFLLLLTSILFAWVHVKSDKNARGELEEPKDIVHSPKASSSNVSSLASVNMQLSETFEDTTSHYRGTTNFKRLLLLVMTILFVQKLQHKYLLKSNTHGILNMSCLLWLYTLMVFKDLDCNKQPCISRYFCLHLREREREREREHNGIFVLHFNSC